jgi:hypothetical protein
MSTLKDIAQRHGRDRWKDALFIGVAVLLTALSIGSVTSKAVGTAGVPDGQLTVLFGAPEIQQ